MVSPVARSATIFQDGIILTFFAHGMRHENGSLAEKKPVGHAFL